MHSNSLIVLNALEQFRWVIILVNLGATLVLVLNCGDGLFAEGTNRLSIRLEPHLETNCVEHVSAVAV